MKTYIAASLLVIFLLVVSGASGCGSSPAATPTITPAEVPQVKTQSYVISDCSGLTTDDIKSVFNLAVTQDKGTVDVGTCAKQWTVWQSSDGGQTPVARPYIAITNTTTRPGSPTPSKAVSLPCGTKPSLGLGDTQSCSVAGDIFFTKGDYLVEVACVNCADDNAIKLANIVNGRL